MKRGRIVLFVAGIITAGLLASCNAMPSWSQPITSFQMSELSTGTPAEAGEPLADFELTISLKRYFGVSGGPAWLGDTNSGDLVKEALNAEIQRQGGSKAANVSIAYEAKMTDIMLNGFTGFIYAPTTTRIKGTVLR
jgi:hypothetical protein